MSKPICGNVVIQIEKMTHWKAIHNNSEDGEQLQSSNINQEAVVKDNMVIEHEELEEPVVPVKKLPTYRWWIQICNSPSHKAEAQKVFIIICPCLIVYAH